MFHYVSLINFYVRFEPWVLGATTPTMHPQQSQASRNVTGSQSPDKKNSRCRLTGQVPATRQKGPQIQTESVRVPITRQEPQMQMLNGKVSIIVDVDTVISIRVL